MLGSLASLFPHALGGRFRATAWQSRGGRSAAGQAQETLPSLGFALSAALCIPNPGRNRLGPAKHWACSRARAGSGRR